MSCVPCVHHLGAHDQVVQDSCVNVKRRAHGSLGHVSRVGCVKNQTSELVRLWPRGGQTQVQVLSTESGPDSQLLCDLGC